MIYHIKSFYFICLV